MKSHVVSALLAVIASPIALQLDAAADVQASFAGCTLNGADKLIRTSDTAFATLTYTSADDYDHPDCPHVNKAVFWPAAAVGLDTSLEVSTRPAEFPDTAQECNDLKIDVQMKDCSILNGVCKVKWEYSSAFLWNAQSKTCTLPSVGGTFGFLLVAPTHMLTVYASVHDRDSVDATYPLSIRYRARTLPHAAAQ